MMRCSSRSMVTQLANVADDRGEEMADAHALRARAQQAAGDVFWAIEQSPSASALRALNAATQIGKSLNILGIVPPLAPRLELP